MELILDFLDGLPSKTFILPQSTNASSALKILFFKLGLDTISNQLNEFSLALSQSHFTWKNVCWLIPEENVFLQTNGGQKHVYILKMYFFKNLDINFVGINDLLMSFVYSQFYHMYLNIELDFSEVLLQDALIHFAALLLQSEFYGCDNNIDSLRSSNKIMSILPLNFRDLPEIDHEIIFIWNKFRDISERSAKLEFVHLLLQYNIIFSYLYEFGFVDDSILMITLDEISFYFPSLLIQKSFRLSQIDSISYNDVFQSFSIFFKGEKIMLTSNFITQIILILKYMCPNAEILDLYFSMSFGDKCTESDSEQEIEREPESRPSPSSFIDEPKLDSIFCFDSEYDIPSKVQSQNHFSNILNDSQDLRFSDSASKKKIALSRELIKSKMNFVHSPIGRSQSYIECNLDVDILLDDLHLPSSNPIYDYISSDDFDGDRYIMNLLDSQPIYYSSDDLDFEQNLSGDCSDLYDANIPIDDMLYQGFSAKHSHIDTSSLNFRSVMRNFCIFFILLPDHRILKDKFNIYSKVRDILQSLGKYLGIARICLDYLLVVEGQTLSSKSIENIMSSKHSDTDTNGGRKLDSEHLNDCFTRTLDPNTTLFSQDIHSTCLLRLKPSKLNFQILGSSSNIVLNRDFSVFWLTIIQGNVPISLRHSIQLAALQYQVYSLNRTQENQIEYCDFSDFLPLEYQKNRGVSKLVQKHFEKIHLLSMRDIQSEYISHCLSVPYFNHIFFNVRKVEKSGLHPKLIPLYLGISFSGILTIDPISKLPGLNWEFTSIQCWNYTNKAFFFNIGTKKTICAFETNEGRCISCLVDHCINRILLSMKNPQKINHSNYDQHSIDKVQVMKCDEAIYEMVDDQ